MTMLQRQVVLLAEMRARGGSITGREAAEILRGLGLTQGQGLASIRRAVDRGHITKHQGGHDGSLRHYRIVEEPPVTPAMLACLAGHRWTAKTRLWRKNDWWVLSSRSNAELSGTVSMFSASARQPETENWFVVPELAGVEDIDEAARVIGAYLEAAR